MTNSKIILYFNISSTDGIMNIDELKEKACNGDKSAEEQLFKQLHARFTYFARLRIQKEADCEEVVQEALTTVYKKYREVEIRHDFAAWLYAVLKNKIIDFYRGKKRERKVLTEMPDGYNPIDKNSIKQEFRNALLTCLKSLFGTNQRYARLIILRYQGYKFPEICKHLKISRSNGYSILSRARSLLLACLKRNYYDER